MAKITAGGPKKRPKTPPQMPGFLEDFSHSLMKTYSCTRQDLRAPLKDPQIQGVAPCASLMFWLNAFSVDGNKPAQPGDPLVAIIAPAAGGSGKKISVAPNEIIHADPNMSLLAAMEMVVLAAANPVMIQQGITVEGTPQEQMMLAYAATLAGLKVNNPPPHNQQAFDQVKQEWGKFHRIMDRAATASQSARENDFRNNMINNAPQANVSQYLGSVAPALYQQAKEKIWNDQAVSQQQLMSDFNVSADDADDMLNAMAEENLIYEDTSGALALCVDKNSTWVPA